MGAFLLEPVNNFFITLGSIVFIISLKVFTFFYFCYIMLI